MLFEGMFTWVMLWLGGVPMAALLGLRHRRARLHPQYRRDHLGRADGRGRLQRRARQGLYAIFVYFFVQNIDGYLVVPYIARRTVDLAPALVLAMQLLMGALFGILGVLFADPILATFKVVLVDLSEAARRSGAEAATASPAYWPRVAGAAVAAAACCCISAAPPRHDLAGRRTSKVSLLPAGKPGGAGRRQTPGRRHGEAIFAAFLHPAIASAKPGKTCAAVNGCAPPCDSLKSNTVPSSSVPT